MYICTTHGRLLQIPSDVEFANKFGVRLSAPLLTFSATKKLGAHYGLCSKCVGQKTQDFIKVIMLKKLLCDY